MADISDNTRGALLMIASMATFTFNDACMKALSDEIPLFQAIFLRGVLTSIMLIAMARYMGGLNFQMSRRDAKLIIIRTLAELAAAGLFISAIFNMPIANATAILQALPFVIALAGFAFFREPLGWRRMSAIIIGFVGVLLIVRPGTEGFNSYSINVILAVFAVTIRDLAARRLSKEVPSFTVAIIGALGVMVGTGIASTLSPWAMPSSLAIAQLIGASVFIIGGYLFSVMTVRVGDISTIAPFRYTNLLWALLLGLVFFGEWPDAMTLLGCGIIVAGGVYTLLREQRLNRRTGHTGLRMR